MDKNDLQNAYLKLHPILKEEENPTLDDSSVKDFSIVLNLLETNTLSIVNEGHLSDEYRMLKFTELPSSFNEFTPFMNFRADGEVLTDTFSMKSKDFLKYFNPNLKEIKDVENIPLLVLKLYNDTTISDYFIHHKKLILENTWADSMMSFKKYVIHHCFKNELIANLRIRVHNEKVRNNQSISSPRLIKFGTLYHSHYMKGYYLIFEKAESRRELTTDNFRDAVEQTKNFIL